MAADNDVHSVMQAVNHIRSAGGKASFVELDVSNPAQVHRAMEATISSAPVGFSEPRMPRNGVLSALSIGSDPHILGRLGNLLRIPCHIECYVHDHVFLSAHHAAPT
jgi:NAD(P)-dependent dehydrogenase (short-subunit alcohol dehydrogenase family)